MPLLRKHLGVDLGTVNVLIYDGGRIVLQEPSLVALLAEEERIVDFGQPAREMLGRVDDEDIQVMRPLQNGVIADYEVTEAMLEYFFGKIAGRIRLFRPSVVVSVPYGATSVEKRAVREAILSAGARDVQLVWEPLASALGAGLPVGTPAGGMVVNIGGGITEAAVLTMNNVVRAESGRVGGLRLDDGIISYVRRKYSLAIGQPTAESIKIQIGAAVDQPQEMTMEIQGRDNVTGLPRTVRVTTGEVVGGAGGAAGANRRRRQSGAVDDAARTVIGYHRPRHHAQRRQRSLARHRRLPDKRDRRPGVPRR